MIDRLFWCINMEVNNKEREADPIRKFEKDELKLFYVDYSSPFSLGDEQEEGENLVSTNCSLFLSLQTLRRICLVRVKIIQCVPSNNFALHLR